MAVQVPVAKPAAYALAALRITLGLIFLWAFLDKVFGLRHTTPPERAYLEGGSPTQGYLGSSFGPLGDLFQGMAGNAVVDVLFLFGLGAVGVALTLGVATKLGGWGGVAMVLLMYLSHPTPWMEPNGTHPFLDEHITEAAAMALLALTDSGSTWGLGAWWRTKTPRLGWLH